MVVLLSPLPLGANRPWSWSLLSLLVGLLSILWSLRVFKGGDKVKLALKPLKSLADIILVFIGVLCWGVYQAIFPATASQFHPLWTLTNTILNTEITPLISLTPADSITTLMRMLSYALVFFLSFYYCQTREKAKSVFLALMSAGFVYSLYGLFIYFGKYGMTSWFNHKSNLSTVSSTFINHNHFATFAGLSLLCSLSLLMESINISAKYNIGGNLGWQRFFENLIIRAWFPASIFLIIGTALVLTCSRGGFASSLLAIIILLSVLTLKSPTRNYYSLGLIVFFMLLGTTIFNLSSASLLAKLNTQGINDEHRVIVFKLTWNAILTNPWLGFGLGSFEEVFPLYKNHDFPGTLTYPILQDYTHNTYLEVLFELGIPAGLALFYCFFRLAWICFKGLLVRKRDWIYPATGLSATALIAAHASVDFSMQIPAIPCTYLLLMGAACGQSFSSRLS
jgi:O-antigen ligase